jgi:hypothetical protein
MIQTVSVSAEKADENKRVAARESFLNADFIIFLFGVSRFFDGMLVENT